MSFKYYTIENLYGHEYFSFQRDYQEIIFLFIMIIFLMKSHFKRANKFGVMITEDYVAVSKLTKETLRNIINRIRNWRLPSFTCERHHFLRDRAIESFLARRFSKRRFRSRQLLTRIKVTNFKYLSFSCFAEHIYVKTFLPVSFPKQFF